MRRGPSLSVLVGAGAVFAFGLLTLASGVPTVISPLGFPVALMAMMSTDWISLHVTTDPFWHAVVVESIAALPLAICFAVWSSPAIARRARAPARSGILFGVLVCLCVMYFGVGWSYGVRYQSLRYTVGILSVNIAIIAALASLWVANWRVPQRRSNVLFHVGVFCWLAWCAIPWLGELP